MESAPSGRWTAIFSRASQNCENSLYDSWEDRGKNGIDHVCHLLDKAVETARYFDFLESSPKSRDRRRSRRDLNKAWRMTQALLPAEVILSLAILDPSLNNEAAVDYDHILRVFAGFDEKLIKQYSR